jgi:hypothetical protein
MYPPKKVGPDPVWNCTEVCPADLIKSLHREHAAINKDEVVRAEWFWSRRPNVLCADLIAFFFYITVFVCLIYCFPQSTLFLIVWMVAGASCVFVDCFRLERWKKEYASSIKWLILPLLKHR